MYIILLLHQYIDTPINKPLINKSSSTRPTGIGSLLSGSYSPKNKGTHCNNSEHPVPFRLSAMSDQHHAFLSILCIWALHPCMIFYFFEEVRCLMKCWGTMRSGISDRLSGGGFPTPGHSEMLNNTNERNPTLREKHGGCEE